MDFDQYHANEMRHDKNTTHMTPEMSILLQVGYMVAFSLLDNYLENQIIFISFPNKFK